MTEEKNHKIQDDNKNEADKKSEVEVFEQEKIDDKMISDKKHKHGFFHHDCDKFKKEAEEYKAGWQRATADYQNLKKEIEAMRGEWARYSEQQILEEFLPVYDNFKKAFDVGTGLPNLSSQDENWRKGIECIMQQFEQVLKNHGVEEIKTVGEMFNPELHEAVGEEIVGTGRDLSVPDLSIQEGMIVREVETGYTMRGKVIKVAKVIVAKLKTTKIQDTNKL